MFSSPSVTMLAWIAVAAVILVAIRRRYFHPLSSFPGPVWASVSEFYGMYWQFRGGAHLEQRRLHEQYGPVVRWGPDKLIVADHALLPGVYHMKADKSKFYESHLNEESGTAFSELEHSKHIAMRRTLAHAYSMGNIKRMEGAMQEVVDSWVSKLGQEEKPFVLWQRVMWLSYDVLGILAFGEPFGFVKEWRDIDGIIARSSESTTSARVLDYLHYNPLLSWLARNTRVGAYLLLPWASDTQGLGVLKALRDSALAKAPRSSGAGETASESGKKHDDDGAPTGNKSEGEDGPRTGGRGGGDREKEGSERGGGGRSGGGGGVESVFTSLLGAMNHGGLGAGRIRAELLIAILAGTGTTATVLHSIILNAAASPDVAAQLQREVDLHFADADNDDGGSASDDYGSLSRLPFLTACIHEAFRISAGPTQFPRLADDRRPVQLSGPNGTVSLPKGTSLSSSSYMQSRNKQLFGDALDEYHPQRWLDVDSSTAAARARYDFRFGYGARTCLGKNLVMVELYLAVARLFHNLDVHVQDRGGDKVSVSWRSQKAN